jgi:hypothetical protein
MKKKQKQKLLNQFRPSLDAVRSQLFHSLEDESLRRYGLPLQVLLDPTDRKMLTIGLAGKANEKTRVNVPIDENFTTVLKRIRSGEQGIFERFRDNLLIEIVSYWNDQRMANEPQQEVSAKPEAAKPAETPVKEEAKPEVKTETKEEAKPEAESEVKAEGSLDFDAFSKATADYPKFYLEKSDEAVVVYEETAKEPRKLAEISMTKENDFTIEKALERKYKVKLTFVPLIEQFAATPLAER